MVVMARTPSTAFERPARREATILHVDMDAFYAAVEVLLDPSLAGRPVIVGGEGRRGVVAAASYEARMFGVRSAMPSGQARRLCPHATFVPGRFDHYGEYSRQIHEIFNSYTPIVEGIALDEAFLDVGGSGGLFGDSETIGHQVRRRIKDEVGLTASVGVAASKFVAKLASEAAKPTASRTGITPGAGVVVIKAGAELPFLHPLPVEALWGVGPVTATRLRRLGVTSIGELAGVPLETLELTLGASSGRHLHELAWGRDGRQVEPNREVQSIGHEETYAWDRVDREDLHRELVRMSDAVATRLRTAGLTGRTVTVKIRYGDFTTITRARTLTAGVDAGPAIAQAAGALLDLVPVESGVRLLGVSIANLTKGAAQQLTFSLPDVPTAPVRAPAAAHSEPELTDASWHDATRAVDQVRARFGQSAVGPAILLDDGKLRLKRSGDTQWGPSD